MIVIDVESQSKASEAGIRAGDIIKEINHKIIKSVDDFTEAVEKVKIGGSIEMFIRRMNRGFMVIKLTK